MESWISWFNTYKGTNLPKFDAGYIDTTKQVMVGGHFTESRKRISTGRKLKIEYGMSNQITLSITIPFINTYKINHSVSGEGNIIQGIDDLVNYHRIAKLELESFIASDTYFFMRKGLRDSVKMIYDQYYTRNGDHSVLWALLSNNDPFNEGFIDSRFFPSEIDKDTVSLADLITYFYPPVKKGSGIDDITIGLTILLLGSPAWTATKSEGALYGQFKIELPYGYTIRSYLSDGKKQFTQANVGSGVTRWSIGLYGEYVLRGEMRPRLYANTSYVASTPVFLNTPVSLFVGNHTHPDSIIKRFGETYKYSEGSWAQYKVGFDFEPRPNRIKIRAGSNYVSKGQDNYFSKYKQWDKWMQSHKGYNSSLKSHHINVELWFINSISKNKIGPFSFDLHAGYQRTVSSENTFQGWEIYWGTTFYLQRW